MYQQYIPINISVLYFNCIYQQLFQQDHFYDLKREHTYLRFITLWEALSRGVLFVQK